MEPEKRPSGATRVAAGILCSRLLGIVREQALAFYFGVGPHADVFRMVLRAPNLIQNLLGEGTLSAAFIPVYSRMEHEGRKAEARRFAGAVFGLLAVAVSALALLGILFARPLVAVLAAGFKAGPEGAVDRYELAVAAVRIVFPMTAFLALSSWALGVLNAHRRFFLPYVAPVAWNLAIIGTLLAVGFYARPVSVPGLNHLLFAACWGALFGGVLQFAVQIPSALRVLGGFRPSLSTRAPGVGETLGNLGPVIAGRGVVQLAGYLDYFLASFLAPGAVGVLGYAQVFYLLPISLFGMSVAASELPELARLGPAGSEEAGRRVRRSLRQMAFLNVPTLVGYLAFGFLLVGLLFRLRSGRFGLSDNWLVYLVLGGYTLGLLASTSSRLLQNTFYALGETRIPARIATIRVAFSAALAVPLMFWLDRWSLPEVLGRDLPGEPLFLGALGLALAASAGAWLELALLGRALRDRLPGLALLDARIGRILLLALLAAVPAALLWIVLADASRYVTAAAVLAVYAAGYLLLSVWLAREEASTWLGRLERKLR